MRVIGLWCHLLEMRHLNPIIFVGAIFGLIPHVAARGNLFKFFLFFLNFI